MNRDVRSSLMGRAVGTGKTGGCWGKEGGGRGKGIEKEDVWMFGGGCASTSGDFVC